MATLVKEPYKCTFIHIPKTGGNSVTRWLLNNTTSYVTKRRQHATIAEVLQGDHSLGPMKKEDLGWTFCIVRNPWDFCVSWYTFKVMLAEHRYQYLVDNPDAIKPHKKKFNIEVQRNEVKRLSQGFDWWIMQTKVNPPTKWSMGCDYIIKLENLSEDFKKVQDRLGIHEPLPHLNKTQGRKTNYRDYYTSQEQIDRVAKRFAKDIELYDYDF